MAATTLPAIHSQGGKGMVQQHRMPSPPSKSTPSSARLFMGHVKKRSQSKKEREIEQRQLTLRTQQPALSKWQTLQYRNAYKHNLCLDMLQEGYHKSFAELFALVKQQNAEREQAGPESAVWNQVLLENEPEKLENLKTYLTRAETADRKDDYAEVYQCQYQLARYFQRTGDKWLSDHFFSMCLLTSSNVKSDGGKMAATGHCNVGLSLEESGDNYEAAENFELFYQLAKDQVDWSMESGVLMHSEACNHLSRIYTTIAQDLAASGELQHRLSYLQKAYDMAKEGGDKKLGGEASYRLGLAYEQNGESQTALKYLHGYLDVCQSRGDSDGMGRACESIAKSHESQGKVEESIKYLEMFVEIAERSKDDKATSRACSNLGAMFNSLGRYDQAVEFFNKAYNIARAMNDTETISSSRVLYGVAAAHKMMENVARHIEFATQTSLQRLVDWKDNRGDEFEKEIPGTPDPSMQAETTPAQKPNEPSSPPTEESPAPETSAPPAEEASAPPAPEASAPPAPEASAPPAE